MTYHYDVVIGQSAPNDTKNNNISNIVLGVIWSILTNNNIIMIRQESKLLRPTNTIIARLHYSILYTVNARPERQLDNLRSSYIRIKFVLPQNACNSLTDSQSFIQKASQYALFQHIFIIIVY